MTLAEFTIAVNHRGVATGAPKDELRELAQGVQVDDVAVGI
ncbi:MAG: hypothetical protein RLZZ169_810 [Pseudomonadota bacterium]